MAELQYVGKSIPRIDAKEKVLGGAMFTDDFKVPRMLIGKILRSPYPHARILRIDTSKAEKAPGVRAVITAGDVPPVRWSTTIEDQYILPVDNIVRKIDDPVAAVAAETLEAAEEALELIEVDYESLPIVDNIDDGYAENPPAILHPGKLQYEIYPPMSVTYRWDREDPVIKDRPNVLQVFRIKRGDIERGFQEADLILENTFETARAHHCQMETHGCIAWIDGNGIVNLITSSQTPFLDRIGLARIYRCSPEKFRIINPYVGGGFGGKYGVKEEQPIAIELARKAGRPVKIILTRRECFLTTECRMPIRTRLKDGYKKDGTLVARDVEMKMDIGAYAQLGAMLVKNACFGLVGTYNIPNFNLEAAGVYTNLPRASAYRGVGTPEVTWAAEQQMEIAAERLGINPLEIRIKNLLQKGDVDVTGQIMASTAAKECLETVAREIGLGEKISQEPGPWKKGRGVALGNKYTCAGQGAVVTVRVFPDGMVEVRHNACEMGQGTHSALAQMAAEEFGISMESVRVVRGDTATTPYDAGSWSSRSIFHTGNALVAACRDAKQQMFAIAGPKLGVPANELETRSGIIYRKSLPSVSMPAADLFALGGLIALEGGEIVGKGSYISPIVLENESGQSERMVVYYAYTAFGVEVAVNEETGEIKLLKIVGCGDMGQPINPKMCEVQIEGGAIQGVGGAILEEMKFDDGIPLNPNYVDYKIPTVMDTPVVENMNAMMACDPFEEGPFGAKGVGESTLSAMGPAIANAVYNAVGVRTYGLPMSREKLWRVLQEKKAMEGK